MCPSRNNNEDKNPEQGESDFGGIDRITKEIDRTIRATQDLYFSGPEGRVQVKAKLRKAFGPVFDELEHVLDEDYERKQAEYLADRRRTLSNEEPVPN